MSMSACGAGQSRCAPPTLPAFRLTRAQQHVGEVLFGALTGTAVAVLPGARRLDRRAYCPDQTWACARRRACRLTTDAYTSERCFTQPRNRPAGSGVGARFGCRAVPPRRCASAVMRDGIRPCRFGAGFGGYSWDAGNKPRPSAGPSPRPARVEVARQPVRPVLPLHSVFRSALLV
jgi:hypothetical protein